MVAMKGKYKQMVQQASLEVELMQGDSKISNILPHQIRIV